jgi:hypothetical protein
MAARQIGFNVERLIAEVATRHRLFLKPDDAAFALVTMNRLVLEESLEAIHSGILEDLALFQAGAQKAQHRAEMALADEVRESAAGIRREIQRDIQDARLQTAEVVQQVAAAYRLPMSNQRLGIVILAAALLFVCGVWAGRISTLWWPY